MENCISRLKKHLRQITPYSILKKRWVRTAKMYKLRDEYEKKDLIHLVWWPVAPNFGDAASPWLIEKMTGKEIARPNNNQPNFLAIGSIIKRASANSKVWGSGAFGDEKEEDICKSAEYYAVRGPLTRQLLKNYKVKGVPNTFGDPALLAPIYYDPKREIKYEIGIIMRWSEKSWKDVHHDDKIIMIDLETNDVESVISQILSCKRIISSSLHGLIFADAYGIPSAWRRATTGRGGVFKFYDYFLTVNKVRHPIRYDINQDTIRWKDLMNIFEFDNRVIQFNYAKLLDACPFLERRG